jgi:hypothetical protein
MHAFDTHNKCVVCGANNTAGDVNGDGNINIDDVTALIDYLLMSDASIVIENADVNGDGVINIADVTALIDILLNTTST